MNSLILRTATRFLMPMILLYSVFLLLRGHNLPGGGFVGGLVAAVAFILYALAFRPAAARRQLRVEPGSLIGLGLLISLASGALAFVNDQPFLTGQWALVAGIKLGTPLLFDLGVYLVVFGATVAMVFAMAESE